MPAYTLAFLRILKNSLHFTFILCIITLYRLTRQLLNKGNNMKAYITFTLLTLILLCFLATMGVICTSHATHAVSGETVLNLKPIITGTVSFLILQVTYFINARNP